VAWIGAEPGAQPGWGSWTRPLPRVAGRPGARLAQLHRPDLGHPRRRIHQALLTLVPVVVGLAVLADVGALIAQLVHL
jgi:hypothetical protein